MPIHPPSVPLIETHRGRHRGEACPDARRRRCAKYIEAASTRLDCIDRPHATHRYDRRGGHEHTHPQPKQPDAFTHTQGSIASAAKARRASNDSRN
eukprot:3511391-Prymnesium_polylepis.1